MPCQSEAMECRCIIERAKILEKACTIVGHIRNERAVKSQHGRRLPLSVNRHVKLGMRGAALWGKNLLTRRVLVSHGDSNEVKTDNVEIP